MPDKKTDWTPDEQFWQEAWADMEKRLDQKRRRRGALLPWLVGALLLVGGGALTWYFMLPDTEKPIAEADVAEQVPTQSEAIVDMDGTTASDGDQTAAEPARTDAAPGAIAPDDDPTAVEPAKTDAEPAATAPSRPSVTSRPARPQQAREVSGRREEMAAQDPGTDSATPSSAELPPAPRRQENSEAGRAIAYAVGTVPTLQFNLADLSRAFPAIELPADELEDKSITHTPRANRFALAAGSNAHVSSFLPGAYAQFSYSFTRSDWVFPVALRYDYGRSVMQLSDNDGLGTLASSPALNMDLSAVLGNALQERLEEDNNAYVNMHSVELRGGVGRKLGDRFTLSGGGGLNYLAGGDGPLIANYGNGVYLAVRLEEERVNFSNLGTRSYGFTAQEEALLTTTINRWRLNLWSTVQYRLSSKLSITTGVTHFVTPFYDHDALETESTRVELGVLRRF